jgi:hypothetical protein
MWEVTVTKHTNVMVIVLLIAGMFTGLLGEGCAATSRSIRVDSSAPAYVISMASELAKQGITTQWSKPTDAGPTRTVSKPYQVFPTTYPATWTVKEIVHPGRGGYYGNVNQTGWVVANDKNDCDWAANTGTVWKQGHDHLNLYRVQNGTMVKVTALDGTQASSGFAFNMSYVLTDRYVIWLTWDQASALYSGSPSGHWQVAMYDLDAGHQSTILDAKDAAWGVPVADAPPEFCILSDSTFGLLLMSEDLASGKLFSKIVLLDVASHKNRVLASSAPGMLWSRLVAAHGGIFVNQISWPRAKPTSNGSTYEVDCISTADGTVTPLFSSPLRLTSGLGETLCLVRDPPEAADSTTGTWSGVTDVWTYDCVHKELVCRFRVPGDDITGQCESATAFAKGIAYAAAQTGLQSYFYSYADKTICYTGWVIGSVFPPGTGLVLNKDQRAYFGDIPDKDVSGNLLVVEPQ